MVHCSRHSTELGAFILVMKMHINMVWIDLAWPKVPMKTNVEEVKQARFPV